MKELSIEEKAKAYDKALERAKECHIDGLSLHQPVKEVIEHIFPSLKESEDERIKKAIIEHFASSHSSMYPYKGFTKKQILAWLEKQGEQKSADKVEPKFNVGDTIYNKELTVFIYDISGDKYLVKDVSDTFDFGYLEISKQDEWRLMEKPVSDDLEEAIDTYLKSYWGGEKEKQVWPFLKKMIIYFAKWQNERMMTKAVDAQCFGFQGDALFSFKLPADNYLVGSEVKVIVIKGD